MANALTQKEPKVIEARAWRVAFSARAEGADPAQIIIREPRNLVATVTPVEVQDTLSRRTPEDDGSLDIVWAPPGANFPANVEHEVESWVEDAATPTRRLPVRAGIRTVRVFWHDGRALLYANPEQVSDAIDAIVRFTLAEREITALEDAIASNWATIDADASLTHSVQRRDQRRQPHVDAMTRLATRMQTARLRVERALEQLDPRLSESSKRLYAELTEAASLHDRLDHVDEPIQFALDQYELANTRLIEAKTASLDRKHALVGHALEVAVVLLLLAELIATVLALRQGA
jgi:hypothetical protein